MKRNDKKHAILVFAVTFFAAFLILFISVIENYIYNSACHTAEYSAEELFSEDDSGSVEVDVAANVRDSTWSKAFDFDNEGIEEHNYQAYTVDYSIINNTKDEVKDFSLKLKFQNDVFLLSAWNGSLEIHQQTEAGENVDTIPDLREFAPDKHHVDTFVADGETLVAMKKGDYINYIPSTSMNAMEVPIEPLEATVPGIIMYVGLDENVEEAVSVEIGYTFHRRLFREPMFWVAQVIFALWLIALIIYIITSIQIKKYKERHERDNVIINESIETFISFIDAKDPYTNGHSLRVAKYTRRIAEEFGYKDEELERIYYVALLHDCGKIGVPDNILGKPDRLTDEEFEIIKSHTVRGGAILSHFRSLEKAGEGALYHHERYDGKGYPEGKSGEDIPFIARMICVADSYDAMNTDRVYRKKLSKESIIEELEKGKGTQFDPKIADVMLYLIQNDQLDID